MGGAWGKMVDFGKSDKMIKISEKGDKPTLTTDTIIVRSLLKNIPMKFFFNKEWNIIESIISVGLSPFPLIFIPYIYLCVCVCVCVFVCVCVCVFRNRMKFT